MKYIGLKLILILAFLTLLNSCKEESSTSNDDNTTDPQILAISAKWNVTNGNDIFESFEFNKYGNYIVKLSETYYNEVMFGKYELADNSTIKMPGFGEILIQSINENSFEFEFKYYEDNSTVVIKASKQEEMDLSNKTNLLCRTWELIEVTPEDPNDFDNWELEEFNNINLTVLFSPAGTYFVRRGEKGDDYFDNLVSLWKWFDSKEEVLCYSHGDEIDCDPDYQVTIPELTSNYLEIHEKGVIYKLKPFTGEFTTSMNYNDFEKKNTSNKTKTSVFPKGSFFSNK